MCVSKGIEQNVLIVAVHQKHAFAALLVQNRPCKKSRTASRNLLHKTSHLLHNPLGLHWICCMKCSCCSGPMFLHLFVLVQSVLCLLVPAACSSDRCCSGGNSCRSTELRPFADVVGQASGCVTSLPVLSTVDTTDAGSFKKPSA